MFSWLNTRRKSVSNYNPSVSKIKIKKTTTTGLKNEPKSYPMSEGNTCIAEPNLKVLPLRII